jgi:hypothetical protein
LPRVIVKAFDIKISPNHCQSEENHPGASLPRPAESKLNAAGIRSAMAATAFLPKSSNRRSGSIFGSR